ncbi:MAG: SRPBCC family protein [Ardenticatenaceae bacterium]
MQDGVTKNIIVKGDVAEVYRAWADFENFPTFMQHIKSVTKTGDRTSHWVAKGPLGRSVKWDAVTTRLEENKRIAWNSTEGNVKTSGQVTFNPLPQGQIEVTVMLKYVPHAGMVGDLIAGIFSDPERMLADDLRNFKAYIEGRRAPRSAS